MLLSRSAAAFDNDGVQFPLFSEDQALRSRVIAYYQNNLRIGDTALLNCVAQREHI